MSTADRILIAATLSREALGIYGVAYAGVGILRTIPVSFGQMLFVKFAEMHGQDKTKKHMSNALDKSTVILSSLFAPIVCLAIACFPIVVVYLLPQFVRGIFPGRLLIAAVFFLGVSVPVTNWCVSTGHVRPVLALRLIVLLGELVAVYLVIRNGAELKFIALCILCTSGIFCAAIIIICNHFLENPFSSGIIRAGKSFLPFFSVLAAILMQDIVYPFDVHVAGARLFASCFLGLVFSLAVSIPFVYWANRSMRITALMLKTS